MFPYSSVLNCCLNHGNDNFFSLLTSHVNRSLFKYLEVLLLYFVLFSQDAVPHMPKGSSIIFISSMSAFLPQPSLTMYGVTKTALVGLTKVGACTHVMYPFQF